MGGSMPDNEADKKKFKRDSMAASGHLRFPLRYVNDVLYSNGHLECSPTNFVVEESENTLGFGRKIP